MANLFLSSLSWREGHSRFAPFPTHIHKTTLGIYAAIPCHPKPGIFFFPIGDETMKTKVDIFEYTEKMKMKKTH
jgi:hypothetical protein